MCAGVVNQHHNHQYKPIIRLSWNKFNIINFCASLCTCSIQTIEDAENLEMACGWGPETKVYDLIGVAYQYT